MIATISLHKTEQPCGPQERLSKVEINDRRSAQISSSSQSRPARSSDTRCDTSYCPEGNSISKASREKRSHQKQQTTVDIRQHDPLKVFKVEVLLLSMH